MFVLVLVYPLVGGPSIKVVFVERVVMHICVGNQILLLALSRVIVPLKPIEFGFPQNHNQIPIYPAYETMSYPAITNTQRILAAELPRGSIPYTTYYGGSQT